MSRINQVNKDKATPEVKEMFHQIESKMGKIPNIFLNMGNSPAVLKGYLDFSEAVNHTSLDPKLREEIALIVGQTNHCHYCVSAHTMIAKGLGLQDSEIIKARECHADNPKSQAILHFAKTVVKKKGLVSDQHIADLKKAGVSDKELAEIILIVVLNIFTNYFNNVTDPKIDFPLAPELQHAKR
jgi:uncharacterized peroxidase-related enzyme